MMLPSCHNEEGLPSAQVLKPERLLESIRGRPQWSDSPELGASSKMNLISMEHLSAVSGTFSLDGVHSHSLISAGCVIVTRIVAGCLKFVNF